MCLVSNLLLSLLPCVCEPATCSGWAAREPVQPTGAPTNFFVEVRRSKPEFADVVPTMAESLDPYSAIHPALPTRRPLTPFMIFAGEIRAKVLADACGVENDVENGREVVKRWKLLAKEEREQYVLKALRDRAFLDEYKNRGRGSGESKKRKARDPNMPRAAKNAYHHFMMAVRPRIKKQYPDLNFQDIGRRIGIEWKQLPPGAKQPYEELAAQDKQRYADAMRIYEATGKSKGSSKATNKSKKANKARKDKKAKEKDAAANRAAAALKLDAATRAHVVASANAKAAAAAAAAESMALTSAGSASAGGAGGATATSGAPNSALTAPNSGSGAGGAAVASLSKTGPSKNKVATGSPTPGAGAAISDSSASPTQKKAKIEKVGTPTPPSASNGPASSKSPGK